MNDKTIMNIGGQPAQFYFNLYVHVSMTDSEQANGFSFEAADNGICTIRPADNITAEVASAIARRVISHIDDHGLPIGLLLDVSQTAHLSIVRLSSLVDTLSGMGVPLAVLFHGHEQRILADLLHNTLAQKEYVAYFVTPADAYAYLFASASRNTPDDLQ
jgi:hypothetical protein